MIVTHLCLSKYFLRMTYTDRDMSIFKKILTKFSKQFILFTIFKNHYADL
jgi:hypothetical protein